MTIVDVLAISALALLGLDSVTRLGLALLRWMLPEPDASTAADVGRAIVLIPARNECISIAETVGSIQSQLSEWPGSRLWVIADNCHDATARVATDAGASVAIREDGRLGKGAVIDWWMTNHAEQWSQSSAIVILDADSRLAAGSLGALRFAVATGADAAQAFVSPLASHTTSRLAGYSEVLMQRLDDEARRRAGWSVPLRGTGMALRTSLLSELAPRLHTLAEDLELDVLLASKRAKVAFVPDAVVFDPKPVASSGVSYQRARWLQGQLQVLRDYWREIFRSLARAEAGTWILLLLLFLRPKVLFIGLRCIALLVALTFGGPWGIAAGALSADAAYYLLGGTVVADRRRYFLDLVAAPHYAALWAFSVCVAAVRRGWLRAGR